MREVNLKYQTAGEEYSLCGVCLQQPFILSEVQVKSLVNPAYVLFFSGQVLAELPKKIIQVEVCPMVPTQQIFYQELKASLHRNKDLKGSSLSKNTMSALMELRKLANHPLLMRRLYTNEKLKEMSKLMLREPTHYEANPILIEEDMGVMSDYELHHLCTLYPSVSHFRLEESAIMESGKFKALGRILPELKEQGLKVLLFSQFVMMLDIMEPYMKQCKHNYLRMDGSTSVGERGEIMDKFINDPDIFVFLLSTKACGLGINLTIANTVILYDIDYNPHNDKQAEDRCHRVGQTKDVTVIKLVSKGTVDESMLQRAQQKLHLEKQMTSDDHDGEAEKLNIADLLKEALEVS
ncbi:putative regulator of chromatin subfamily A containing DEAD/H box 1-like [Apostichopus japonicus]|uniref:Putative regulator of chromatin subfamily A containing DEAD/H box 1-like n=1 Tax=Stichopus japonicus TaxID=307972 RepID=A0A2G8L8S3_STIJA|nr:putative regulator of chromatin subfamily A containing DEAD/H box 1-like [Apostichopus japonicus]